MPVPATNAIAHHRMMITPPIRVLLELRPDQESLTGRAHRDGQPVREFAGWLGLLAVLQALLADESAAAAKQPEPPRREAGTEGNHG